MMLWNIRFDTVGRFSFLPRLLYTASETQSDTAYHLQGRLRTRENQIVFKYTLSGTGAFRDELGEHLLGPGEGFLCEVSDPATEYYYPPAAREPWTFVWATFDGNTARQWTRDLVSNGGHLFRLPRDAGIIETLRAFGSDTRRHRVVQADWSAEFVLSLLLALTRIRDAGAHAASPGGVVRRAQELVANNLDRDINGKQVAALLRISREHLSRVFRRETGIPLHDYILQQKMDYACHLLRHSDLNSKEIAARLGYDSPAHFGRTFRRLTGLTPGDFRAEGRLH